MSDYAIALGLQHAVLSLQDVTKPRNLGFSNWFTPPLTFVIVGIRLSGMT